MPPVAPEREVVMIGILGYDESVTWTKTKPKMQQQNNQSDNTSPFPTFKKWTGRLTSVHIAAGLLIIYGAALLGLFPLWLVSKFHTSLGLGIELDIISLPLIVIPVIVLVIFGPFRNIKAGILLVKGENRGGRLAIDALFFDTLLLIIYIYFGYYGRSERIIEKISNQSYILIPLLLLYHAVLLWTLRNSKRHLK